MKLPVIIAGSVAACVVAYNAYSQTCASQPTCSELGYTLTSTSTSSCVGAVLKCPFDKSKFYCTKKADVLNQIRPDWNRRKLLSTSSGYYSPTSDGIIIGSLRDIPNTGSEFRVNGNGMALTGISLQRSSFFAIVKPDDSVYIYGNDIKAYFVPFAGN